MEGAVRGSEAVDDEELGPCPHAMPPRSSVKSVSQKLAVGQFCISTAGSSQEHSWLMLHTALWQRFLVTRCRVSIDWPELSRPFSPLD